MRDDKDDDPLSDESEMTDEDDIGVVSPPPSDGLGKVDARRKLERLRELKQLREELGDDWSDDLLGDD